MTKMMQVIYWSSVDKPYLIYLFLIYDIIGAFLYTWWKTDADVCSAV